MSNDYSKKINCLLHRPCSRLNRYARTQKSSHDLTCFRCSTGRRGKEPRGPPESKLTQTRARLSRLRCGVRTHALASPGFGAAYAWRLQCFRQVNASSLALHCHHDQAINPGNNIRSYLLAFSRGSLWGLTMRQECEQS